MFERDYEFGTFDDASRYVREHYLDQASTVLEAIRLPDAGIVQAASGSSIPNPEQACLAFTAMVDLILRGR